MITPESKETKKKEKSRETPHNNGKTRKCKDGKKRDQKQQRKESHIELAREDADGGRLAASGRTRHNEHLLRRALSVSEKNEEY
jgi:hypothetical protein